jgi:hypothetical protein
LDFRKIALDNPVPPGRKVHSTYEGIWEFKLREKLKEEAKETKEEWDWHAQVELRQQRSRGDIKKSNEVHDIRCQYLLKDIASWCHTSPIVV